MPATGRRPLAVTDLNAIPSLPIIPGSFSKPSERSLKRKAIEEYDEEDSNDGSYPIDENCDQVRRKINAFMQTGEMKVGEFQKALGVNSRGYHTFLQQTGKTKGAGSNTYFAAFKFFKKREALGIKIPKKRVKREDKKNDDVSDITLEGEDELDVAVWDTCDEIRKKISAYLRHPGVTQAGFLREIAKTYPEPKTLHSKLLNDFRGKKGPNAGNTSSVFYASYVFFEKLRIRDGKPKSEHRLDMEDIYPAGFETKRRYDGRYIVPAHFRNIYEDEYGRIVF